MKKILILKNEENDFEKFYSKNMRRKNVDVMPIFKESKYIKEIYHSILRRLDYFFPVYSILFGSWKRHICEYSHVIVFDYRATPQLLRRIHKKNSKATIILYNWNTQDYDMADFQKWGGIFCFDKVLCTKYGWQYGGQFYFDLQQEKSKNVKKQVFFVGLDKGRSKKILDIYNMLVEKNILCDFHIFSMQDSYPKNCQINRLKQFMEYGDVISHINNSSCILEIMKEGQTGPTIRTLEALFYGKKLITDNQELVKYDFYNKNNIFILGMDSLERLEEFMNTEVINVPDKIKQNYTYENWLSKMLDS